MAKKKQESPFTGRWRIVSMSAWEDDFLDEEVEAYIEFNDRGWGEFHFGNVQGRMDCRLTTEGEPVVEWSWEGNEEMNEVNGRGWAVLGEDGHLHGRIFIHDGEDSEFEAKRGRETRRRRRQRP